MPRIHYCPSCQKSKVFLGIYRMHDQCPNCGHLFRKEEGYFIGSMIVSYTIGGGLALLTLIILIFGFKEESAAKMLTITIGQTLLLHPLLYRYSRLAWIHVDHILHHKGI